MTTRISHRHLSVRHTLSTALRPLPVVLALACTTTGGAHRAISERVIVLEGERVRVEDAARVLYQEAEAARAEDDYEGARKRLQQIEADYPDASIIDAVTIAQAKLLLDEKRAPEAQRVLEAFLLAHPAAVEADEARYLLALSQLAQGETDAASPALERMVEQMPSEREQLDASRQLAEELHAQGQAEQAARYLGKAWAMSQDPSERAQMEERLLRLVDEELDFAAVRRLREVDPQRGSLLDEVLLYKLARIHLHLRDYVAASEAAAEYLRDYPAGRFQEQAKELALRLRARVEVEPRTIGVVLPLSGTYKGYGQRVLTAIKLGLGLRVQRADYERAGDAPGRRLSFEGKLGRGGEPFRLIVRDSRGDANHAAQVVEDLIEEEHVLAIIGDILLDTALPVALKGEEFGVPVLSLSRKEGIAELGPWSFRLSFTAQKQAEALAQLAVEEMGLKRFAILYPRHAYGIELMNAFWDALDARGGEVTAIESYGHDQTTFTTEAKSLVGRLHLEARSEYGTCRTQARELQDRYRRKKALERCRDGVPPIVDFDALLIPDDYRTVSYVVPALAAEDILVTRDARTVQAYRKTTDSSRVRPVQLLGGSMWNHDELGERLGRQIEGAILVDGFSKRDGSDQVTRFLGAFSEVHRSQPALLEAHAYDAGHLVGMLLGRRDAPPPRTREEMRAQLAGLRDVPGVTGRVRFTDQGDSATPPRFFMFEKSAIVEADRAALKGEGDG